MKKSFHPILMLTLLTAISIFTAGCPVGVEYPFCEENQKEKVDSKLLGTWKCQSKDAEILEVRISKADAVTYSVEVLDQGENFMSDDTQFFSWGSKLDGHNFLFSQGAESSNESYFLYEYSFDGKKLVIHDVGLLVGGLDAVTSTAAFRQEVSASLKNPDCLSDRFEYVKQ
ncbi:MAG: hypothetical protein GC192_03495 [Bacteroidetes bacterium]|nr:hypothetical protein [Bacteroidota bacterium]